MAARLAAEEIRLSTLVSRRSELPLTPPLAAPDALPFGELSPPVFERVVCEVMWLVDGMNDIRGYGRSGQDQGGLDLVGRRKGKTHVYQVRRIVSLSAPALRAAVTDFTGPSRTTTPDHTRCVSRQLELRSGPGSPKPSRRTGDSPADRSRRDLDAYRSDADRHGSLGVRTPRGGLGTVLGRPGRGSLPANCKLASRPWRTPLQINSDSYSRTSPGRDRPVPGRGASVLRDHGGTRAESTVACTWARTGPVTTSAAR